MTWIPVSERLPDAEYDVLVFAPDEGIVWMGAYDGDRWTWPMGTPVKVSHWQPLPEPPREHP